MSTPSGDIPDQQRHIRPSSMGAPSVPAGAVEGRMAPRAALDRALGELGPRTAEYIEHVADEVIDVFSPDGETDIILRFARDFPQLVMRGLLGMDERYAAGVGQSVPSLIGATRYSAYVSKNDVNEDDRAFGQLNASFRLEALLIQLVEEKQKTPGRDLVSWMLHHGPDLTLEETAHQARSLLLVTLVSSEALIGNNLATHLPAPETGPRRVPMDPCDQPQLAWVTGERAYPPPAQQPQGYRRIPWSRSVRPRRSSDPNALRTLTELIVDTGVQQLHRRLQGLRLKLPREQTPWGSIQGIPCPQWLPVAFTPARFILTEESDWPPEPIFTTAPPPPRPTSQAARAAGSWRSLVRPHRTK